MNATDPAIDPAADLPEPPAASQVLAGPSRARVRAARIIAGAADLLQLALPLVFGEGLLSPLDDVLDAAVAAALIWLVGWHWAFVPSALAEVVPGVDLLPTWTAAVFAVTGARGGGVLRAVLWIMLVIVLVIGAWFLFHTAHGAR